MNGLAVDPKPVRAWAALDLVVTAPLALPPTARAFVELLYAGEPLLGGDNAPPELTGLLLFFVCLAGALGVVWAAARLWRPSRELALIDALGRCWVAVMILYCVAAAGAPRVLLLFLVTELAGAASQRSALRAARSPA